MKRKKMYEAEVDKIQNVKMTQETLVINLESAVQNADTFTVMEAASTTMARINIEVGIDKVDNVMDAIKEAMETANEINDALSASVDPCMVDNDELLAELYALDASDVAAELLAPPAAAGSLLVLPPVPPSQLPAPQRNEADDLKQLEAELAGL